MLSEIVLGLLLLLLLWYTFGRKPKGLPPGLWGLPLIGYIPLLNKKSFDDQLLDLQKQYGDIYVWRFGTHVFVFLHDYRLVKETFSRPEFSSRPDWNSFKLNEPVALGVAGSNGLHWQLNRRFSLRQLRDLGMGKSILVGAIHNQATQLVEALKVDAGKAAPVSYILNVSVVNIIWQMVANKQFDAKDPILKEFEDLITELNNAFALTMIPDILPWIKSILPTFALRRIFKHDLMDAGVDKFLDFFKLMIDEHRENLDVNDPKDVIDAYLIEMQEKDKISNAEIIRTDKDLALLILDLFSAGSETTIMTLNWLFLYMAINPNAQRKLQDEIDEVLPKGTLPELEDKAKLPYLEAVLNEVLRMSSLTNIGVQHSVEQDTMLGGYFIPKDAVIHSATASIHFDPRYWENPHQFMPERWLNEEGKFVLKKEGYIPFSIGKRVCIGEGLARMELMIFTAAVFQSLTVSAPPGKTITVDPIPGSPLFHQPQAQDLVFTLRE